MLQGVQRNNAMQAMTFTGNPTNVFYNTSTKPYANDSFNGKTIATLAGLTAAIIFRKNIGRFFSKHLPNFSELVSNAYKSLSKPIKNFLSENRKNPIVKFVTEKQKSLLKFEKNAHKKVHKFFHTTKKATKKA